MPTYMSWLTRRGLFFLSLLLAHSSWSQEAKEPTRLDLKVTASAQANLDDAGRPSPVRMRIYELKDSNGFGEADYFSLSNSDKTVLAADLLVRDEFILRPGESRRIERKSHPQTTAIGILAGYRDLTTVWRVIHPLPEAPAASWMRMVLPSKKAALSIQIEPHGLVLKPTP
jgi:type VI secretion system protein VasD